MDGLEFSPDGSKLYITKRGNFSAVSRLYQYDLNAIDVKSSKVILHQNNTDYNYCQIQIAPNGKIYCAMPHDGPEYYSYDEPQNLSLSVIHNPNEAGEACNYEHLGQYLGGKKVTKGLPNMPNYNLGPLLQSECDTLSTSLASINYNNSFTIAPNPAQEMFYIKTKQNTGSVFSLRIVNTQGAEVMYVPQYIPGSTVSVSQLPEGMYAVLLTDEKGLLHQQKLIISR